MAAGPRAALGGRRGPPDRYVSAGAPAQPAVSNAPILARPAPRPRPAGPDSRAPLHYPAPPPRASHIRTRFSKISPPPASMPIAFATHTPRLP